MPYINKVRRAELDNKIFILIDELQKGNTNTVPSSGELNYTITELLLGALNLGSLPSYTKLNTAIGVLECIKLEIYRRIAEYENIKRRENGDTIGYGKFEDWLSGFNKLA